MNAHMMISNETPPTTPTPHHHIDKNKIKRNKKKNVFAL